MGVEFIDENRQKNQAFRPGYSGGARPGFGLGVNGPENENRGIVGWVIKKGWAKNHAQANIILLVVAVIFFVLAFAVPALIGKNERVVIYREEIDTEGMSEAEIAEVFKNFPSKYSR